MKFLIAEDDSINAEIVALILSSFSFEFDIAENGKTAFEMFYSSPLYFYSMILMDIQMPVMNGFEAAKKIRSLNRPDAIKIPIIAVTANTSNEDIANMKAYGLDSYITKPVNAGELYKMIDKYNKV